MEHTETHNRISSTGFLQQVTKYAAKNCGVCPLNGTCHKSKGNRVIEINHSLNRLKEKENQHLLSEEGIKKTTMPRYRTHLCKH